MPINIRQESRRGKVSKHGLKQAVKKYRNKHIQANLPTVHGWQAIEWSDDLNRWVYTLNDQAQMVWVNRGDLTSLTENDEGWLVWNGTTLENIIKQEFDGCQFLSQITGQMAQVTDATWKLIANARPEVSHV